MKKIFLYLMMFVALTACSSDDNSTEEQSAKQKTYEVNIHVAGVGDIDSTRAVSFSEGNSISSYFRDGEEVYVYKQKQFMGVLYVRDINQYDGSCYLRGTLTGGFNSEENLWLLYNINGGEYHEYFDYNTQNGLQNWVLDGAKAQTSIVRIDDYKNTLVFDHDVWFTLVPSMFSFKFVNQNNEPIVVKNLRIQLEGIRSQYDPKTRSFMGQDYIEITPPEATSDYIYVGIPTGPYGSKGSMTFTVTDNENKVYTATKNAPGDGFTNGKYYYSTKGVKLTEQN
jgi:hypothetical protein